MRQIMFGEALWQRVVRATIAGVVGFACCTAAGLGGGETLDAALGVGGLIGTMGFVVWMRMPVGRRCSSKTSYT